MNFEDFFQKQMTESGNGYDDQIAGYKASQTAEEQALEAQRATQAKKLEDERYKAQQDAYVARRMSEKNLPQLLAAQGISGGMTETTASNIYNDYLNAQNKANSAFSTANTEAGNNYTTNLASLKTKWAQAIGEAEQQKRTDAFAKAQWAYQAWQAEEERKRQEEERRRQEEERRRQEEAAAAARASSYSSGGGGGDNDEDDEYNRRAAQNKKDKASGKDPYAWQNRSYGNKKKPNLEKPFVPGGYVFSRR